MLGQCAVSVGWRALAASVSLSHHAERLSDLALLVRGLQGRPLLARTELNKEFTVTPERPTRLKVLLQQANDLASRRAKQSFGARSDT